MACVAVNPGSEFRHLFRAAGGADQRATLTGSFSHMRSCLTGRAVDAVPPQRRHPTAFGARISEPEQVRGDQRPRWVKKCRLNCPTERAHSICQSRIAHLLRKGGPSSGAILPSFFSALRAGRRERRSGGEIAVQLPRRNPVVDRPATDPEAPRQLRFRHPLIQTVRQQHPRLPSMHRPTPRPSWPRQKGADPHASR